MSDRIDEFIIEAREHLGIIEEALLVLEKSTDSNDALTRIDRCFRSIHSIKGDAGFLGLTQLHELAHAMENLLGRNRSPLSLRAIEALLAARDRLAVMVDDSNRTFDISDILSQLSAVEFVPGHIPIDINLTEWNADHPGGIISFIRQATGNSHVTDGRIHLAKPFLREGLPTGVIRWTGFVEATALNTPLTSQSQTKAEMSTLRTEQFKADLSALSKRQFGLVNYFRELAKVVRVVSSQVSIPVHDLRSALPNDPVTWSGKFESTLNVAELEQQFDFELATPRTKRLTSDFVEETLFKGSASTTRTAISTAPAKEETLTALITKAAPIAAIAEKSSTLRIQIELLDRMMTLVGELTLVRNQSLLAFANEDGPQRAVIQRLNSVTSELQDVTLRARMQPVGNLFNKFPRMVRDLARQLGKQVEIKLQGREVELDKTILEQLSDPLMHLIRNSVDHGIEMPEVRVKNGKSPIGQIVLSATHEDGQVHIQVRDDGRGIDPQTVKAKALSLKLRSEAELERMSPRELFSLILLPGFSTAKMVTEVSGRGVGMDVVKTNIEQLEGTLGIDSAVGQGCSMAIRLPLTLAIIPCLIVTVEGDRFAVPQRDLEEVVCLHPKSPGRIEQAFNTEVYRLRDKLLPIVRLTDVLSRKEPFTDEAKAEILASHLNDDSVERIQYILVLKIASRRFGLVVDEVRGTQEIVVKPMHASMKRVGIFTGATIMGDGRVALITDSEGIVAHARLSFESALEQVTKTNGPRDAAQVHRVLLFEYGLHERFALPLLQIRRVEMVNQDRIERVGDHEYVTVDGISTRILRLNNVLNVSAIESDLPIMSLVLPKFVPQPMAILVTRIVDTESLALDLQEFTDRDEGILGSATVRGRLTLFLEMHRLSERLFGNSAEVKGPSANSFQPAKRLLLIDDTAFFREVVKRYLSAEGYEITTAIHGEDGLKQLSSGRDFDLIVSDIEMPVMDGWEFARQVRLRGIKTPMLALTSLSGAQYETKAKECGYDGYETKLDHGRLVRKVSTMVGFQEVSK